MNSWGIKPIAALTAALSIVVAIILVLKRPGYLTNAEYLGALLFLEALGATIWKYRQRFFPVLILIFLLAGTEVPMQGTWGAVRWFVLALGALAGIVIYLKDYSFSFQAVHWIALSCVVAAAISAEVSSFPKHALLKALSLFLLFVYCAFGARLALVEREEKFFAGLLWACEALIYFTAVLYFILHRQFFGNPNSLGAVMGIVIVPMMFWGILISQTLHVRNRRLVALLLALGLLLSSYSRASIIAAAVSCILLCAVLGSYRLLMKGLVIALLIAIAVAYAVPPPNSTGQPATISSRFLFKGKERGGVLGSRRSVWDSSITSIEAHPWFGIGFGTASSTDESNVDPEGNFGSNMKTTREHGNSYLAILEGVGLLGVLPFLGLVVFTVMNSVRVLNRLWHTKSPFSPAVPIALILIAGLIHALFEDWLFAVGYYMCVFFWALAFMLLDLAPGEAQPLPDSSESGVFYEEPVLSPGL